MAVRIEAGASIRVRDISIATDLGLAINPDGVKSQLKGGAVQSCSWTLKEQLSPTRREITTRSWADDPILSFSEVPKVTVGLINRPEQPAAGGCGHRQGRAQGPGRAREEAAPDHGQHRGGQPIRSRG